MFPTEVSLSFSGVIRILQNLEVRRHGVDDGDPGNRLFKEGLEFLMAFGIDFS